MSNITVYKFVKKIWTNLQTVAEKTAKNFGGLLFLPHPVEYTLSLFMKKFGTFIIFNGIFIMFIIFTA